MVILALTVGIVSAGPNQGVRLYVQGNVNGMNTSGHVCTDIPIPSTCEEIDSSAMPDSSGISWYLAVVLSSPVNTPNFNTVVFGLGPYDPHTDGDIIYCGPCIAGALEISTAGWPGPGEGTAMSWAPDCSYSYIEPIYYFGTYNYGGVIPLTAHPVQGGGVVDCSANPQEDSFEAYGEIGGDNPLCWAPPPAPGACCFGPDCVLLLEWQCWEQSGVWYGGACNPDGSPCPPDPTPVQETTWGSIKVIYE
ncbi:MAG: hypothetical protein KJ970_07370 [Candidatus Eisenbacteria bacterium]|uniref:Uncharacterized protein n=1 Tax=Eiseniibacteriota bacterium TaxID=2212470 RepID=A0A948RWA4_UNCEI|nr:hypothetical protein [Candidatus Eisenbacteria bacterium]